MKLLCKALTAVALMGTVVISYATDTASVPMYLMGRGQLHQAVGTVVLTDVGTGLQLQPNLKGLNPALAAGAHTVLLTSGSCVDALRSPLNSGASISGIWPALMVNVDGTAITPVVLNNWSVQTAVNKVVVVRGGDNGQGYHILCGVVPAQAKQLLGNKS